MEVGLSSKRVLNGTRDFAGQCVGNFVVADYVSRHPQPRWKATCQRCGTEHILSHQVLLSGGARCLNSGCGKEAMREAAADTPRKARERAEAAASKQRHQREEAEAAKLREAEASLTETARKLYAVERDNVLQRSDDELFIDPATANVRMTPDEANRYNAEQAAIFRQRNPNYHVSKANLETLGTYLEVNGIRIASAEAVQAAYARLDSLGLIEHATVPTPERREKEQPSANRVDPTPHLSHEKPKREGETGIDPLTGLERFYTVREINRLSSDEYRRAFPTYSTVSSLFSHNSKARA